jgi:hypothetical protein
VRHILDLLASQLRIHWQRDYFVCNLFRDRQRYFAVALLQVSRLSCQQSQVQCRRTGRHADCSLRADGSRKCLLEIRHFRAENETRIADNTFDGPVYFGFVCSILGFEIDQRYSDDSLPLTANSLGAVGL